MTNDDGQARIGLNLMSESNLARRISWEMRRRGWSQERMAKEMTNVGYPLHQSSISKIVNPPGGKRRAISVDDAIGFAQVFGVTFEELLVPLEAVWDTDIRATLARLDQIQQQREAVDREAASAVTQLVELLQAAGEADSTRHMQAVDGPERRRLLTELTRWAQNLMAQLDTADTSDGMTDSERIHRFHAILFGDQSRTGDAT